MAIDREEGVRVVSVDDLLDEDLLIPPYQRRYSWEPATAEQLLDDIALAFTAENGVGDPGEAEGRSYVLGAVILHRDEELQPPELHVVDGQQRLLTLTMLLRLLENAEAGASAAPSSAEEEDPQAPVVRVRMALDGRVRHMEQPGELARFIRSSCELIRVETDDRDEAFRVFDSQNYRGKPLLPHDLLKAYHLREMRGETKSMKVAIVAGWEAVSDAELDRLFSTYLWRIKRWSRGLSAPTFAARDIATFKGLTSGAGSPVARYHLAAQAAVPMFSAWSGQSEADYRRLGRSRFQLDAPVQAGRTFFEMVTFMLGELKELREVGFHAGWEEFASTDGDLQEMPSKARYRYVSELYLAALLYYTNKFGDRDLLQAKDRLFKWAYCLRTAFQRVQFRTVNNHARDAGSAFVLLRDAETETELRRLAIEVKGRDQNPDHEQNLLRILNELVG